MWLRVATEPMFNTTITTCVVLMLLRWSSSSLRWETSIKHRLQLSDLDMISILLAAACHDYDLDGFNNSYYVNSMTMRSVRYHNEAVQENYHAAEPIMLLVQDKYNNMLENIEYAQIKVFRKCFVGLILANDIYIWKTSSHSRPCVRPVASTSLKITLSCSWTGLMRALSSSLSSRFWT